MAPFAPGTFGTLAAIPVFWFMNELSLPLYLVLTLAGFLIGIYLCDFTSRALGVHDHSGIVWDEIIGYLITMIALPGDWVWMLAGFIAFRFFDILKPWPIRLADKRLHGGFGIMFDDVLAGIFAMLTLHSAQYFL